MAQFKADQPLEERLTQIHVLKVAMYAGQVFFIVVALLNFYLETPFLGKREMSFLFVAVALIQFLITRYFIVPRMTKKAHETLPEN